MMPEFSFEQRLANLKHYSNAFMALSTVSHSPAGRKALCIVVQGPHVSYAVLNRPGDDAVPFTFDVHHVPAVLKTTNAEHALRVYEAIVVGHPFGSDEVHKVLSSCHSMVPQTSGENTMVTTLTESTHVAIIDKGSGAMHETSLGRWFLSLNGGSRWEDCEVVLLDGTEAKTHANRQSQKYQMIRQMADRMTQMTPEAVAAQFKTRGAVAI